MPLPRSAVCRASACHSQLEWIALKTTSIYLAGGLFASALLSFIGIYVYTVAINPDPTRDIRQEQAEHSVSPSFVSSLRHPLPSSQPPSLSTTLSNPRVVTDLLNDQVSSVMPAPLLHPTPAPDLVKAPLPISAPPPAPSSGYLQPPLLGNEIDPGESPVPQGLLSQNLPPDEAIGPTWQESRTEIEPARYPFNNLSASALDGDKIPIDGQDPVFELPSFAPQGEDIVCVMGENAASNNFEIPIKAYVWFPMLSGGHLLLEPGTELLGTGAVGTAQNRIQIRFNKIIFKNRKSLSFSGVALGGDGLGSSPGPAGIPGLRVGNIFLQNLGPIVLSTLSGLSQNLQRQTVLGSAGGLSLGPEETLKNSSLSAGQALLNKIGDLAAQDLEDEKPYVLVPAGTRFFVRLMAPLDISGAGYGR